LSNARFTTLLKEILDVIEKIREKLRDAKANKIKNENFIFVYEECPKCLMR